MDTEKTALVIGATGGIGGEVARALLARGWRVQALTRRADPAKAAGEGLAGVEWIAGDAMNRGDVAGAAAGASVIVHGANPPGYRNWAGLAMPMLESTIAAAEASGARIVLPGNTYNYGPDAFPVLREDSPQNPLTRKGKVRVAMEAALRAASGRGVRSLIVRAGDFFGPHAGSNWFAGAMVTPGKPVRTVWHPGAAGVGHAWAYLPDLAGTMVRLAEREAELEPFAVFHFGGHWLEDAADMPEAVRRAVGDRVRIRAFPWWAMRMASPFLTLAYELQEMRYLWQEPIRLDNAKLAAFLGKEPHTPLNEAVRTTLVGLGCLPAAASAETARAA